jgi:hypothetical protein
MATSSGNRVWTLRGAAGWVALLAAAFALAAWLRYGVIQPQQIGIACAQADAPGWCQARQWLISAQHYRIWGWVGLGCAIAGLFWGGKLAGGRLFVALGLCFAALALVLYNATLGAPAMVIGLLALLRCRASALPSF